MAVFGVAVFACFSWTILGFLNKLSSFILRFTFAEIAEIFAFMMAFALLESLLVTGFVVLLAVLLPPSWLKEGFPVKGLIMIVTSGIASILFQQLIPDDFPSTLWFVLGLAVPLALIVFLNFFISSHPKIWNILLNIQDRISIMLYVYVPLGLVSLIVYLYRNLL